MVGETHPERGAELQLSSAALKGKYSIATRVRILETQLDGLVAYLETRPDPIEPMVYKDLIELLRYASSRVQSISWACDTHYLLVLSARTNTLNMFFIKSGTCLYVNCDQRVVQELSLAH